MAPDLDSRCGMTLAPQNHSFDEVRSHQEGRTNTDPAYRSIKYKLSLQNKTLLLYLNHLHMLRVTNHQFRYHPDSVPVVAAVGLVVGQALPPTMQLCSSVVPIEPY